MFRHDVTACHAGPAGLTRAVHWISWRPVHCGLTSPAWLHAWCITACAEQRAQQSSRPGRQPGATDRCSRRQRLSGQEQRARAHVVHTSCGGDPTHWFPSVCV